MIERRPVLFVIDEAAAVLSAAPRSQSFASVLDDMHTLLRQARRSRPRGIPFAGVSSASSTRA